MWEVLGSQGLRSRRIEPVFMASVELIRQVGGEDPQGHLSGVAQLALLVSANNRMERAQLRQRGGHTATAVASLPQEFSGVLQGSQSQGLWRSRQPPLGLKFMPRSQIQCPTQSHILLDGNVSRSAPLRTKTIDTGVIPHRDFWVHGWGVLVLSAGTGARFKVRSRLRDGRRERPQG